MRFVRLFLLLVSLAIAPAAHAEVKITFHSFNGSVIVGRYPHTFVSLEGTLADGTRVRDNFGFSAKSTEGAAFGGPTAHVILREKDKWLLKTNRHFTIPISDQKYREVMAEIARWRDYPGKYYDLNKRNCIHFVGAIAKIVGLKVDVPEKLTLKPRAWLNYITGLNPQLGAKPIS